MKTSSLVLAALACALVFPGPPAAGGSGEWKSLAGELARGAAAAGAARIAVLEFTASNGAEKQEAGLIAEEIGAELAGRRDLHLIDRAHLEKVLKEASLSDQGGASVRKIFSVDAVVTGTVFASGEKLKVAAKLIDLGTGRVLAAALGETEREWPALSGDLSGDMNWEVTPWRAPSSALRDAPADRPLSCESRQRRLESLNAALVDAKARYWAGRMKQDGFTIRSLTRNPGTEISNPAVRARFYELLKDYYRLEDTPPPGPAELGRLDGLMEEEDGFYNECGAR